MDIQFLECSFSSAESLSHFLHKAPVDISSCVKLQTIFCSPMWNTFSFFIRFYN